MAGGADVLVARSIELGKNDASLELSLQMAEYADLAAEVERQAYFAAEQHKNNAMKAETLTLRSPRHRRALKPPCLIKMASCDVASNVCRAHCPPRHHLPTHI
jgi:hypothetical protein